MSPPPRLGSGMRRRVTHYSSLVTDRDKAAVMPNAWIGTSGWNYAHWKERFYPRGVRQADWLGYLAERFNSAEVNYSFYRIPKREAVENWLGQVPSRFRFAVKVWRGITQYKKLKGAGGYLKNFLDVVEAVPTRNRGPLLVQLPPGQGRDLEKLDAFLDELRELSPSRWKVAVEFRHPSWLCDEAYHLLDRQRAALCLHDMKDRAPVNEPNDASFIYMRRHGSHRGKGGGYTPAEIEQDAQRVRQWLKAGKMVFVYYNNDWEGHAVRNARALAAGLEDRG
jgi:uncharacterized protein YecE (DUF72 family)